MPDISVTRTGPTMIVRIERPTALNALRTETLEGLVAAFVDPAPDVGAVVLWGGPKAFSAGADLDEVADATPEALAHYVARFQDVAAAVQRCPVPTVAAVAGPAIGGGLELAVNCDARVAASDAVFRCPEVAWGLTCTNGSSRLLRDLVGEGWARELLLFGTILDATRAAEVGLVTRVVAADDLFEIAVGMATEVTMASGPAVRATKRLLGRTTRDLDDVLAGELAELLPLVATGEATARVRAVRR